MWRNLGTVGWLEEELEVDGKGALKRKQKN